MDYFSNQFHSLRAQKLAKSTKDFLARGKSVSRCELCQLARYACICSWRPSITSRCDFILLMHHNEIFKPTNSGRLIAEALPTQTHVFCWSRTEPDKKLLALLSDKNRQCFIVFPTDKEKADSTERAIFSEIPTNNKIATFILLDGTWKQSGRMFHLSHWLDEIACVSLPAELPRSYAVRKSHQDNFLSTAEAGALCLQMANESENSEILLTYFQIFNEHYLATRGCYAPTIGEAHQQLKKLTSVDKNQK